MSAIMRFGSRIANTANRFGGRIDNGLKFGSRLAHTASNVLGAIGAGAGAFTAAVPNPYTGGIAAAALGGQQIAKVVGGAIDKAQNAKNMLHAAHNAAKQNNGGGAMRPSVPAGRHMSGGAGAQAGPSRAKGGAPRDFRKSTLEAP